MGNSKQETKMKWWEEVMNIIKNWITHKNKEEWLKDMRGNLSLLATVIATMTFQTAINPPGGIRPAPETGEIICSDSPCPGEAVLSILKRDNYNRFLYCNTVCFVASLAVCLLLVSGLPLNNRFFTWLFSIGMCVTLTSLTFTYFFGVQMVTPQSVWGNEIFTMFGLVLFIWMLLLAIVAIFLSLRLIVYIFNKRRIEKPSQGEDKQGDSA